MGHMIHADWLLVVLTVLSVARLTHLVTTDVILDRPRGWLMLHGGDKIAFGVTCAWCVSWWLGLAVAPVVYFWHRHWPIQIGLLALAASYLTGLLEQGSGLVNAQHELAAERAEELN